MQRLCLTLGLIFAACASAAPAQAQSYPNKTVRIVVPYGPGGGVSLLAQQVAQKMQEQMKQPVVVDNRPGAGGNLGADLVAKSPPDGYTLLMHSSAMASLSSLYSKLPFDPVKDFVPVTMVISTQFVIGGSPKNPGHQPQGAGRARQGKARRLQLRLQRPRLVAAPVRRDVQQHRRHQARAHPLSRRRADGHRADLQRHPARLPAAGQRHRQRAEQPDPRPRRHRHQTAGGAPRRADRAGAGLQGPRGRKLGVAVRAGRHAARRRARPSRSHAAKALADPQVREWLVSTGQEPVGNSPAEFDAQYKADIARYAKVIDEAKIPKLD